MREKRLLIILVFFLVALLPSVCSTDYPEGLMYYYKLNNKSADMTKAVDSINAGNEALGVSITGSEWENSFNATYDKAIHLDGTNDYFDTGIQTTASFTIMVMVYSDDDVTGNGEEIMGTMDSANGMFLRRFADEYVKCYTGDGDFQNAPTDSAQPHNTWIFYTCTYNATSDEIILYVNGTAQSSVGSNGYNIGTKTMFIGGIQTGQGENLFDGKIDEVAIWNITLDANNVSDFWKMELGSAPPPPPPPPDIITINIISPDNNTYSNSNLPNITFTAIGNDSTVNCNILFDGSPYGNNASVLNNTNTIIPLNASLSDGNLSYYINCSDGSITNVSETRRIIIDTEDPTVTLEAPVDDYITNNQSITFEYNVLDDNINNCSIYIDSILNETKSVDDFGFCYQEQANETSACGGLDTGRYSCEGDFDDAGGNYCWNAFDKDWTTFASSKNQNGNHAYIYTNYSKPTSSVGALWKVKDYTGTAYVSIPSSCWDYNATNLFLQAELYVQITGGPDQFIYWKCKNNSGWETIRSKGTRTFAYEEGVEWRNASATLNFTVNDLGNGLHNWSIECYDKAGNNASSTTSDFRIDITDPTIDSYSPDNNTVLSWNENVTFDLLTSDNGFIYLIQSNITNPSGSIVYDLNYTDTGGAEESSIRLNGSVKLNTNGTYTWIKYVCDGHTDKDIKGKVKDPSIDLATKKIDFKDFRFLPKDPNNIEKGKIEKLKDRYTFGWELKEIKKTKFDLLSSYKLDYFPKSQQFIIGEKRIWIDFVGLEDLKITKVSDYHYIIETTPKTKEILARSVGALNCIHETSYFDINNMGLNLTAKEYSSNATINTFTATILNLSWAKNTTIGYIEFNLSAGNYTIEINASGYARKNETIEILGHENLTSYLYAENSVLTNIYDQDTGVLINNASVLFDANTTYYQTHTTTNGSVYITGLPTSSYDLTISSTSYIDSNYQIGLTGANHISLNAYLLNSSNLVVITIKSDETDKFIEGAGVVLTRKVNGSWVSVGSQTTDGVGAVRFGMKEGAEYKLQISASGYNTKEITLKPYENSYTIYLVRDSAQTFYTLFNKIGYRIMPYMLVIPPYSYNNPITCFNLTTSSSGGYLDFFGLNGSINGSAMNISNITGSPNGATAGFCLNLTNFNGYNITIDYWIKANGEALWENQRQYFITNLTEGSATEWFSVKNYSMEGWLTNYGSEIPTTWKIIIMVAVAVGLMLTFAWWLPPMVTGFIGVAVIGIMSFVWFPAYTIISMILIVIMAIMYLVMEGRG